VTGLELTRRIVGLAHVKDITSLINQARVKAERICLSAAIDFIVERHTYTCGSDFLMTIIKAQENYKEDDK
jgi:5-methylthioribose kinase